MVCPVANSRLWPRLAGSIHRRALRDRFTNPALPTPTPTPRSSLSYLSLPVEPRPPARHGPARPGPASLRSAPVPSRVRVSAKQPPASYRPAPELPFAIPKHSRQRFSRGLIRPMRLTLARLLFGNPALSFRQSSALYSVDRVAISPGLLILQILMRHSLHVLVCRVNNLRVEGCHSFVSILHV